MDNYYDGTFRKNASFSMTDDDWKMFEYICSDIDERFSAIGGIQNKTKCFKILMNQYIFSKQQGTLNYDFKSVRNVIDVDFSKKMN